MLVKIFTTVLVVYTISLTDLFRYLSYMPYIRLKRWFGDPLACCQKLAPQKNPYVHKILNLAETSLVWKFSYLRLYKILEPEFKFLRWYIFCTSEWIDVVLKTLTFALAIICVVPEKLGFCRKLLPAQHFKRTWICKTDYL